MQTRHFMNQTFPSWLSALALACGLWAAAPAWAQRDCRPAPADVARLVELRPGFHTVAGPLAEFDPCHRSVQLSLPGFFSDKLADKPPVMVIAHGGNGPGAAEQEMVRRLNARGVATLLYDAYETVSYTHLTLPTKRIV